MRHAVANPPKLHRIRTRFAGLLTFPRRVNPANQENVVKIPHRPGLNFLRRGSLFLTRPTLVTYAAKREDLLAMSVGLFAMVLSKKVRIEIGRS